MTARYGARMEQPDWWMRITVALQTLAIGFTAWVAHQGINSWSKENRDRRKLELAEETLDAASEATEALPKMRDTFTYPGEGMTAKEQAGDKRERLDFYYALTEREARYGHSFNDLRRLRTRVKVYFGQEAADAINQLLTLHEGTFVAARHLQNLHKTEDHLRALGNQAKANEVADRAEELAKKLHNLHPDQPDYITDASKEALHRLDSILQPIIEGATR